MIYNYEGLRTKNIKHFQNKVRDNVYQKDEKVVK